jgi:hypothetical protein
MWAIDGLESLYVAPKNTLSAQQNKDCSSAFSKKSSMEMGRMPRITA